MFRDGEIPPTVRSHRSGPSSRTPLRLSFAPPTSVIVIISEPLQSRFTSKGPFSSPPSPAKYQTLSRGRIGRWRDGGMDE